MKGVHSKKLYQEVISVAAVLDSLSKFRAILNRMVMIIYAIISTQLNIRISHPILLDAFWPEYDYGRGITRWLINCLLISDIVQ